MSGGDLVDGQGGAESSLEQPELEGDVPLDGNAVVGDRLQGAVQVGEQCLRV
jgi:hypothetical protein